MAELAEEDVGVENVSWDPGSVGRLDMGMGSDFQGAARGGCQPAIPTLHLVSHRDARVHGKVFSCQGSPVMQSSEGPHTPVVLSSAVSLCCHGYTAGALQTAVFQDACFSPESTVLCGESL